MGRAGAEIRLYVQRAANFLHGLQATAPAQANAT